MSGVWRSQGGGLGRGRVGWSEHVTGGVGQEGSKTRTAPLGAGHPARSHGPTLNSDSFPAQDCNKIQ